MANLITSGRFLLLFLLVAMAYFAPPKAQLLNPALLIVIIALDGLDGYVARKRGETSVFGSVYDIIVDRVVENVLWVVLADLDLVPVWVAIVFITRGLMVDTIRSHAATHGESAFGMMRSPVGRFLVAGRFMRGFYGTVKAIAFGWILAFQPVPALWPAFWTEWSALIQSITATLVYVSVAVCVLRGVPVLVEFYLSQLSARKPHASGGPR